MHNIEKQDQGRTFFWGGGGGNWKNCVSKGIICEGKGLFEIHNLQNPSYFEPNPIPQPQIVAVSSQFLPFAYMPRLKQIFRKRITLQQLLLSLCNVYACMYMYLCMCFLTFFLLQTDGQKFLKSKMQDGLLWDVARINSKRRFFYGLVLIAANPRDRTLVVFPCLVLNPSVHAS